MYLQVRNISLSNEMNRVARVREDRISALPKAVIRHILSFLPTLDSVRTTVLSKRWNNMWASVSSLDFDDDRDDVRYFFRFVNCVLMFRDSSSIQKFQLKISGELPGIDVDCVEDWICAAVRRNVVVFHLKLYYRIPRSVFTCKTVRALRLDVGGSPIHWDYPSACFPKLKFLHVTMERPEYEVPEMVFSSCPVVEDMIIDGSANNDNYDFNICAPELKSLSVCLADPSDQYENNFQVNAPKLEKLVLESVFLSNYNLETVKSLVSASITFDAISAYEFESFPTRATALLAGISNVKCLSLSTHSFEVSYLTAFNNLKKLDMLLHKCKYWELLAELLYRAPNLEDMVLEDETECGNEYSDLPWNPPEAVPICLSSHLKTITIKGFKGSRVEMGVAKYLLNSGQVLNKLTLYTGFLYTEAEEMKKEFLMFHRSMSCQVEFIKM
ncbi:hypothetical protein ACLB2K_029763 [Fragaria x ananassa]